MANNFRVKNTDLAKKVGEIDASLADMEQQTNRGLPHNPNKGGVLSIIFDDARQSLYDLGLPIFKETGIKPSVAIWVKSLEKTVTPAMKTNQLLELYNQGFDFMCHGYDSFALDDNLDENVAIKEVEISKKLANKYGIKLNGFVPSNGIIAEKYIHLVAKNYKYGFCNYESDLINYKKDIFNLNRISIGSKNKAFIDEKISQCATEKKYCVFFLHDIVEGDASGLGNTTGMLLHIISECKRQGVKIMPVNEAVDYLFNLKDNNNIFPTYEIQLPLLNEDNSLNWSVASGSAVNLTSTYINNIQKSVKLEWNNAPYDSRMTYFKDVSFNTDQGNTYMSIEAPLNIIGKDLKLELRVEFWKGSTNLGIECKHILRKYYNEKDLLKTNFMIPKGTDIDKIRFTLRLANDLANNSATLILHQPTLTILNSY